MCKGSLMELAIHVVKMVVFFATVYGVLYVAQTLASYGWLQ